MRFLKVTVIFLISIQSILAEPATRPATTTEAATTPIAFSVTTPLPTTAITPDTTSDTTAGSTLNPTTDDSTSSQEKTVSTPLPDTDTTEAANETTIAITTSNPYEDPTECLYKNQFWPSIDGTKFYFCLPGTNTPVVQSCSRRTFFVLNSQMSGCIPFSEVGVNCVNHDVVGPCDGDNLLQPQSDLNPTNFYICTNQNATPLKLQCPEGTAFLHEKGYLGCFAWKHWRQIRGCPVDE